MTSFDHFTPLSRAVASIDRDSYAERFAIYDREYKSLLRRLATNAPVSDADLASEERAFRDAVRRIEFPDQGGEPSLVPQDAPVAEAPSTPPRREPFWPQVRPQRREPIADAGEPEPRSSTPSPGAPSLTAPGLTAPSLSASSLSVANGNDVHQDAAGELVLQPSGARSVTRRIAERLALGIVLLAVAGAAYWMNQEPQVAATDLTSTSATAPPSEQADNAPDPKLPPPTWMSPQMFYSPPPMPEPAATPVTASSSPALRGPVPLPIPRPEP